MLLAVGEQVLDHVDDRTVRMAGAFMGGAGGTREELCGVLSAGIMIIGALLGPRYPGDDEDPMKQAITTYRERFIGEIGPTKCAALRDGLYGSEGQEACRILAQRATRILLETLEEYTRKATIRNMKGEPQ